ncbi:ABC transporter permease subunit [Butyrivibrio sp. WCD3002]|uniref:ABC transporter permease subunit n=1 Tax=Butyrivibrio sp. WCD3002 TaxID=1280676 RepID=UPI000478A3C2|nr:ABC transporter permease subunit [Butyrivibrio sp. WCD3002]
MRNLLRADLKRIFRVGLIYIGLLLALIYISYTVLEGVVNDGSIGLVRGVQKSLSGAPIALFIVFPTFYAVFAHELSSKSMQAVLGHGITRDKLIVAKLLDAAIVLLCVYLVIIAVTLAVINGGSAIILSSQQQTNLVVFIILRWLRHFGYIVFSAMIMYISGSTVLGIVVCVAFTVVFKLVFNMIEFFSSLSLYDYTFDGLLDWAYTGIEMEAFPWQLLPAACYLLAALAITTYFFRRKEFDF